MLIELIVIFTILLVLNQPLYRFIINITKGNTYNNAPDFDRDLENLYKPSPLREKVLGEIPTRDIKSVGEKMQLGKLHDLSFSEIIKEVILDKKHLRTMMTIFVSVALLGCSLYVILSGKYNSGTQNWAFLSVGAISGFWLRTEN